MSVYDVRPVISRSEAAMQSAERAVFTQGDVVVWLLDVWKLRWGSYVVATFGAWTAQLSTRAPLSCDVRGVRARLPSMEVRAQTART